MKKVSLFLLVFVLLLSSCSSDYDKRLKISATTWIGYIPLFYAKEKGWLKPLNIKIVNTSSLAENMYLYQAGNSDAYVGTQYEYGVLHSKIPSLIPVMLLDKSNGGDLVMSNISLVELEKTDKVIDIYLELDSINSTVLKDFLSLYHLEHKELNYINKDQVEIQLLKESTHPTIIVTYNPYNLVLQKKGFQELASTKGSLNLLVVDALFTQKDVLLEHKQQFKDLKVLVDRGIEELERNPHAFYETVKPYLLNMQYDEFTSSVENIIWINKNLSLKLQERLTKANFQTRDLL